MTHLLHYLEIAFVPCARATIYVFLENFLPPSFPKMFLNVDQIRERQETGRPLAKTQATNIGRVKTTGLSSLNS